MNFSVKVTGEAQYNSTRYKGSEPKMAREVGWEEDGVIRTDSYGRQKGVL